MQRSISVVLVLLVVSSFALACASSQAPGQVQQDIIRPHAPLPLERGVKLIRFRRGVEFIQVPNVLTPARLRACTPQRQAEPPESDEPGAGGYACWTLYGFEIKIAKNPANPLEAIVTMTGDGQHVRVGDCVVWYIKNEFDARPAGITLVNFFDTKPEAEAAGKTPPLFSEYVIGQDFCTWNAPFCFMSISTDKGTYRYQVKIDHDGKEHVIDPELEVVCTPPGCGDPDDAIVVAAAASSE